MNKCLSAIGPCRQMLSLSTSSKCRRSFLSRNRKHWQVHIVSGKTYQVISCFFLQKWTYIYVHVLVDQLHELTISLRFKNAITEGPFHSFNLIDNKGRNIYREDWWVWGRKVFLNFSLFNLTFNLNVLVFHGYEILSFWISGQSAHWLKLRERLTMWVSSQ